MLAITIDTAHAVTVSIAVTLFATQSAPPSVSLALQATASAGLSLARHAHVGHVMRSVGAGEAAAAGAAGAAGWGDITSVRLAVASLLVWHDIAPLAVQQHSCFSSTSVSCISLSFVLPISLSHSVFLSLCIMTFTVISRVICKANAANGKIINIKIKL